MDAPVQSSVVYADLLRASLSRNAPRRCFHVKRNGKWQSWTYADFGRDLNRCTDALKKAGFRSDDKGVVIGENCPEWVIAYHAFFCAGGYTVPVDPNLPAAEIGEIIRLSQAGFVVCSSSLLTVIEELCRGLPSVQKIIILNGNTTRVLESFNDFCMTGNESAEALAGPFYADDPTVLLFTSGTTGKAKGVVLTQQNFVSAPLHGVPRMKVSREDTMLAVLPLHHVFGAAANIAAALCTGMDLVFVASIKGPLIMEAMREKHVSILPAVPKMVALFYNAIEHTVRSKGMLAIIFFRILFFLSMTLGPVFGSALRKKLFASVHATFGGRLNLIVSGGASLGKKYFNGFLRMGFTIVEGYGLTETFGPITLCPGSAPKLGSVGTILPDNDIKIREPNARGVGEVLLRGACVFKGYYANEQQTRAIFDAEGWFYTGDLGFIDRRGYLFLSGRIKDVIILDSGKNAYPDELEDFYGASELIEEIGVFGATIQGKEIIAALIVASAAVTKTYGTDKTPELIHSEIVRMSRNLPSYKKLTDFLVVAGPLPKTTTLKFKKHELRQWYFAARDTTGKIRPPLGAPSAMDAALSATEEFRAVERHIISLIDAKGRREIFPSNNLDLDLGLDSMKRVELCSRLEESLKLTIADEALFKLQTVGDLCRLVAELKSAKATPTSGEGSMQTIRQRLSAVSPAEVSLSQGTNMVSDAAATLAFSISKMFWKLTVGGVENLSEHGPCILCANHQSYIDILWLLYALPPRVRANTFTTGKSELLSFPLLQPFIKNMPFIPVERGGDVLKALRLLIAVLKQGKNLIIFPEGGRSRTGGIIPFKAGIGMLMLETNAAVIPVKIKGSYEIWPPGELPKFLGGRHVSPSVTFGPRFTLQKLINLKKLSAYSTDEQIAACVQDIVEKM